MDKGPAELLVFAEFTDFPFALRTDKGVGGASLMVLPGALEVDRRVGP